MTTVRCFRCEAIAECRESSNGKYQWIYNDEMKLRCQEMCVRRQAGETNFPISCSEMQKAAGVWISSSKSNYASQITQRSNWFRQANKLLGAAESLEPSILKWWEDMQAWSKDKEKPLPEHEFQSTYMMLCSYATENFCKGWLASRLTIEEREKLKRTGELPRALNEHNLFKLVGKIGMPLIDYDEELLHRLTCCAVWYGRYHIPKDYQGGEKQFTDGKWYNLKSLGANDISRIKSLVQRLSQHVNEPDTFPVPRFQREKEEKSDQSE